MQASIRRLSGLPDVSEGSGGASLAGDAAFTSGLFGVTKSTVGDAFAPGLALGDVRSPAFAFERVLGGVFGALETLAGTGGGGGAGA